MKYCSTRDRKQSVSAAEAILLGLAPDGGLFLPTSLPQISEQQLLHFAKCTYPQRAAEVLSLFLDDYSLAELQDYAAQAYSTKKYSHPAVAPLVTLDDNTFMLELFHGPTCAFKDFALQMLPFLLTAALKKLQVDKTIVILVATSGDTGKAALEGFADIPGTKICVFYPNGGTSNIQRLQMTTQHGDNVMVAAVNGNFDDAQTGVKQIFTDARYTQDLAERGYLLSSANSINWGRLAPQIAYYVSAYCDLLNQGRIQLGEPINVTVPTGNFGNILAAYLAKACGLPIGRFICASNRNNVLTEFINSGIYDRNRPFFLTSSPSMDILISSNLERLLYLLADDDDQMIRSLMQDLQTTGRYQIPPVMTQKLQAEFSAGTASDAETAAQIQQVFRQTGYLCDTHTAVGLKVYRDYQAASGDQRPTVIASTASPFKFAHSVLPALGTAPAADDFAQLQQLQELANLPIPRRLADLQQETERFTSSVAANEMKSVVDQLL